jgi:quercetin dioxygenase-like cupin family protein
MMRRTALAVTAVLLGLAVLTPKVSLGQPVAATPTVESDVESRFPLQIPLPAGPLDHILLVVNLDPGAATPIHQHPGPGFATILEGEVTHRRLVLDHDTVYRRGDSFAEIPEDVHFARNAGPAPATILATFVVPHRAIASVDASAQPDPQPPAPEVPALARFPIPSGIAYVEVVQQVRTYAPGASATIALAAGDQAVVLVLEGQLTATFGKDRSVFGPGESWVETAGITARSWNDTASSARAVVSILRTEPQDSQPVVPR